MRRALEPFGSLDDWDAFADELERPRARRAHGGRRTLPPPASRRLCRRRRGRSHRAPAHQPHYQALDYNPLNGGVARWFAPIDRDGGRAAHSLRTILAFSRALFSRLATGDEHWQIEVHQFRIEAQPGGEGLPTPEGMHRDGVDFVARAARQPRRTSPAARRRFTGPTAASSDASR